MKNKRNALLCLIILLLGSIYLHVQAQKKESVYRASFYGEWKLNTSKSEGIEKFPQCIFGNDRMRSKALKITENQNFITLETANLSPKGALVTRKDKLVFDGKERDATFVGNPREESTARWSDHGQSITVNSVRTMPFNIEPAGVKVTEVWKLINDGKSISIQVKSRSTSGENTMVLVYDKQQAADYRF